MDAEGGVLTLCFHLSLHLSSTFLSTSQRLFRSSRFSTRQQLPLIDARFNQKEKTVLGQLDGDDLDHGGF